MALLFHILLVFLGTLTFLRVVGQAIENQRRALEIRKWQEDEAKRREEMTLLVADTIKIDV